MLLRVLGFWCIIVVALGSPSHRPIHGRIVGGNETTIELNPWQVSIQMLGIHSCGGSIISEDKIVTAAHCINTRMPVSGTVVAGKTNLSKEGGSIVGISKTEVHENNSFWDYDIAIITLKKPLVFSDTIQAIKLPKTDEILDAGTEVNVTGWGVLHPGETHPSSILYSVTVNIVNHDDCIGAYGYDVTDRMLCAGEPEGGKDACQDDSGGPLSKDGTLYGVVSWGNGCALPGYPGVYSDVAVMRNWIKDKTGI